MRSKQRGRTRLTREPRRAVAHFVIEQSVDEQVDRVSTKTDISLAKIYRVCFKRGFRLYLKEHPEFKEDRHVKQLMEAMADD